MQGKLDLDNLIMIVIALIGMFQAFDRMGVFESAYQCVDAYTCNSGAQPGYGVSPNIFYLEKYNVGIINDSDLSDLQRDNLLAVLDHYEQTFQEKFPQKKVMINLLNDSSYELPQMVIFGLSKEHLEDEDELYSYLDGQLNAWALNSIPKADNIQLSLN